MHLYGSVFDKLKWKNMNMRHVITSKIVTNKKKKKDAVDILI